MAGEGIIIVLAIVAFDVILIVLGKRLKRLNALFGKPANEHKADHAPNDE